MHLETERLYLIPLTAEQLRLFAYDLPSLEKELKCCYRAEPIAGVFGEIVKVQAKITKDDEANYLYHTFWLLIRKNDHVIIGAADFKDTPDKNGEIELGYGLGKEYEKKGYMTEAVLAMCGWALKQKGVLHVIAETEVDGAASQKLLTRCGFSLYRKGDTCWWKL